MTHTEQKIEDWMDDFDRRLFGLMMEVAAEFSSSEVPFEWEMQRKTPTHPDPLFVVLVEDRKETFRISQDEAVFRPRTDELKDLLRVGLRSSLRGGED